MKSVAPVESHVLYGDTGTKEVESLEYLEEAVRYLKTEYGSDYRRISEETGSTEEFLVIMHALVKLGLVV